MLTPRQEARRLPRRDVIYHIGSISLLWNRIDYHLETMLRILMGADKQTDAILSCLGTQDRGTLLTTFLEEEFSDEWVDYALHILKGINICRDNRNLILHGIHHKVERHSITIERFTRKLDSRKKYIVSKSVLKDLEADLIVYGEAIGDLIAQFFTMKLFPDKAQIALPDKPPLPRSLAGILPEVPSDDQLPY